MSSMEVSNLTRESLRKIFEMGERFDGRKLLDVRGVEIEHGISNKAEGSARVRLGKTEVIAGVKMGVGEPYPDSEDSGNLIVSGDLLPLASPRFEMGPPKFNAIELPRLIDRMIRESGAIDLKKLAIKEGEKVWTLFIDVYPLNDDGALIDAASIACMAALKNTVIPVLDSDGKIDYEKKGKNKLPLSDVFPVSFSFYKLGDSLILHPTREEEEACEAKITWGISKWKGQYMINSCQKGWDETFSKKEISKMMEILPKKYEEILKKIDKYIK